MAIINTHLTHIHTSTLPTCILPTSILPHLPACSHHCREVRVRCAGYDDEHGGNVSLPQALGAAGSSLPTMLPTVVGASPCRN